MEDQKNNVTDPVVEPGADPKPTPTIEDLTRQVESLTAAMSKQKKALDTASSDVADWKRKYYASVDEATAQEEKRKEAEAEKDRRIAELERKEAVGQSVANFLAMGYSADLAKESAEALYDGDTEKLFDLQKTFLSQYETTVKTSLLNKQPEPTPGKAPSGLKPEDPALAAFKRGARGY